MAVSEGWLLKELDQDNKHCQRYIQLAVADTAEAAKTIGEGVGVA